VAMERDCGTRLTELRVDGGMIVNELLMQFQADILGVNIVRPRVTETTALGAAYAAGLACGRWKDPEELREYSQIAKRWTPAMSAERREQLYRSWQKAVARALDWVD